MSFFNNSVYSRYPTNIEFRMKFLDLAAMCHRWITPILLVTGFIGNSVSFLIWMNPRIKRNNSSATYLSALSLSDLILLLTHFMHYLKFAWRIKVFDYAGVCEIFQMVYLMFQYNSSPLVLAFTLERWIAVCYPFKRERWCTSKRAYLAITLISIIMLFIGIVQAFGWTTNNEQNVCKFRESWQRSMLNQGFTTTVEFLMSGGVPICTLVFNILVIYELRSIVLNPLKQKPEKNVKFVNLTEAENDDKKKISFSPQCENKNDSYDVNNENSNLIDSAAGSSTIKRYTFVNNCHKFQRIQSSGGVNFRSTTIMLLTVSFYQIFTTLPSGAVYVSQFFISGGDEFMSDEEIEKDPKWRTLFQHQTIKEFVDLFSLTHYCFNVLIYLLTGRQFRKYLLQILKLDILCYGVDTNNKTTSNMRSSIYGGGYGNTVIANPMYKKSTNF